jgi:hypothetical protein
VTYEGYCTVLSARAIFINFNLQVSQDTSPGFGPSITNRRAVVAVLNGVIEKDRKRYNSLRVATDHFIELIRNELWRDNKTGQGIEPALLAQFYPLEALVLMGAVVWCMIKLEADDALASTA